MVTPVDRLFEARREVARLEYRFRAALQASDAILISSPEYARGVSGVLKNALHASLCETLRTMSGYVVADASITLAFARDDVDADGNLCNTHQSTALASAIEALARSVYARRSS
jgi:multimeric flavodoxin WrbA